MSKEDNLLPKVERVAPLDDYKIFLEYDNGVSGQVDLSELKGKGVFTWWERGDNFSKVHIDSCGGIAWNEDIDIDALHCYLKITNQTFEEYANS
ncbi:MAG: DUF2442 domain-containing protein [Edaphocola sp.]